MIRAYMDRNIVGHAPVKDHFGVDDSLEYRLDTWGAGGWYPLIGLGKKGQRLFYAYKGKNIDTFETLGSSAGWDREDHWKYVCGIFSVY